MGTSRILLDRVRWLSLLPAFGLVHCLGSDNQIILPEDSSDTAALVEGILGHIGIEPTDPDAFSAGALQLNSHLIELAAASDSPDQDLHFNNFDPGRPWLGQRIKVHIPGKLLRQKDKFLPPLVVVTDTLEYAIESDDCAQDDTLELNLDPETVSLYVVQNLQATCTDGSGTRDLELVFFRKTGHDGDSIVEPAMDGLDGLPLGSPFPSATTGAQCGDPGQDGMDALITPGGENTGGTGGNGATGEKGGEVATTYFALLSSTNARVAFDLSGGQGGDGQDGGDGGIGGSGQNGGHASSGMPACCQGVCMPGDCNLETLVPAGHGGIGGDGGASGNGGRGGNGGNGGFGGAGGKLVAIVDMGHFAMFDVYSTEGGRGGRGGRGGSGGSAGTPGLAGEGGWDGANCEFISPEKRSNGKAGMIGQNGQNSLPGNDGPSGERGTSLVIPYSPQTSTPAPRNSTAQ